MTYREGKEMMQLSDCIIKKYPDFRKVVRPGTSETYGGRGYSIFVRIEYKEGNLSLCGVEGPLQSGNCLGSCGQIDMHEWNIKRYAPGWTPGKVKKLRDIWKRWHLNDLTAGTPLQEWILRTSEENGCQ